MEGIWVTNRSDNHTDALSLRSENSWEDLAGVGHQIHGEEDCAELQKLSTIMGVDVGWLVDD